MSTNTTQLVKAITVLSKNPDIVRAVLALAKETVIVEPKKVSVKKPEQPDALRYAGSTLTGSSITKYGKLRQWQAMTVYGSYNRTEDNAPYLRVRENGEARVIAMNTFTGSINRRWPTGISTESWTNGRRTA
jgi:hypothetical protein